VKLTVRQLRLTAALGARRRRLAQGFKETEVLAWFSGPARMVCCAR
jgi:hypothetical protein